MKRYLNLYFHFFKYNLISAIEYKTDFITWSLVTIGWIAFTLVFYQLLFSHISNIAGWDKAQMLILQGFYFYTDAVLWGLFYKNLYELPYKINHGTLDLELVKPINKQFLLSVKKINLNQINSLVMGSIIIIYGLKLGNFHAGISDILFAMMAFTAATVFLYSGWFITICLAFWVERLDNIIHFFPNFRQFSKFPLDAYQGLPRMLLGYAVPILLVTTLPSQFLLHQRQFSLLTVFSLISISLLIFSRWFFNTALRRYSSASS